MSADDEAQWDFDYTDWPRNIPCVTRDQIDALIGAAAKVLNREDVVLFTEIGKDFMKASHGSASAKAVRDTLYLAAGWRRVFPPIEPITGYHISFPGDDNNWVYVVVGERDRDDALARGARVVPVDITPRPR